MPDSLAQFDQEKIKKIIKVGGDMLMQAAFEKNNTAHTVTPSMREIIRPHWEKKAAEFFEEGLKGKSPEEQVKIVDKAHADALRIEQDPQERLKAIARAAEMLPKGKKPAPPRLKSVTLTEGPVSVSADIGNLTPPVTPQTNAPATTPKR